MVKKVVYSFRYRLGPGQVGREVFHIVLKVSFSLLAISMDIFKDNYKIYRMYDNFSLQDIFLEISNKDV